MVREAGASVLTYELYPLGSTGRSIPVLTPPWPKREAKRIPILFLHGVLHNAATFTWIKQRLALSGWTTFRDVNFATTVHSIPTMAEQAAWHVRDLMRTHGVDHVDIVAHSMGGLIARYFVQLLGGDGLVRNLITLGTPHRGTSLSRYSLLPRIRELSPDSPTIKTLSGCTPPRLTQATSISGALDILMWPRDCVWWPGVRNIHLEGVGHAGLLFSRRVVRILKANLSEASHEALSPHH